MLAVVPILVPGAALPFIALIGLCGLAWTICYMAVIQRGFKEKTCCMPIEALALNFVWEALFGFVWHPAGLDYWQMWINRVWCGFDLLILATFFMYGHTRGTTKFAWRSYGVLVIVATFAIFGALYMHAEASGPESIKRLHEITAFGVNVPMSMLFLRLLWNREGTAGQSMGIAWTKFIGTGAATIAFTIWGWDVPMIPVILAAGWTCFVLDALYIRALRKETRQ